MRSAERPESEREKKRKRDHAMRDEALARMRAEYEESLRNPSSNRTPKPTRAQADAVIARWREDMASGNAIPGTSELVPHVRRHKHEPEADDLPPHDASIVRKPHVPAEPPAGKPVIEAKAGGTFDTREQRAQLQKQVFAEYKVDRDAVAAKSAAKKRAPSAGGPPPLPPWAKDPGEIARRGAEELARTGNVPGDMAGVDRIAMMRDAVPSLKNTAWTIDELLDMKKQDDAREAARAEEKKNKKFSKKIREVFSSTTPAPGVIVPDKAKKGLRAPSAEVGQAVKAFNEKAEAEARKRKEKIIASRVQLREVLKKYQSGQEYERLVPEGTMIRPPTPTEHVVRRRDELWAATLGKGWEANTSEADLEDARNAENGHSHVADQTTSDAGEARRDSGGSLLNTIGNRIASMFVKERPRILPPQIGRSTPAQRPSMFGRPMEKPKQKGAWGREWQDTLEDLRDLWKGPPAWEGRVSYEEGLKGDYGKLVEWMGRDDADKAEAVWRVAQWHGSAGRRTARQNPEILIKEAEDLLPRVREERFAKARATPAKEPESPTETVARENMPYHFPEGESAPSVWELDAKPNGEMPPEPSEPFGTPALQNENETKAAEPRQETAVRPQRAANEAKTIEAAESSAADGDDQFERSDNEHLARVLAKRKDEGRDGNTLGLLGRAWSWGGLDHTYSYEKAIKGDFGALFEWAGFGEENYDRRDAIIAAINEIGGWSARRIVKQQPERIVKRAREILTERMGGRL